MAGCPRFWSCTDLLSVISCFFFFKEIIQHSFAVPDVDYCFVALLFRAFEQFLDGGLIANNPTLDVLTEMQEYNAVMNALGSPENIQKPTVVVSLGTGLKPMEQVLTFLFGRALKIRWNS